MVATVVTSENAQEFYATKLAPPEPPQATDKVEPVGESDERVVVDPKAEATQVTDEAQGKQKVHLRFSELTERAKAAEAKATKAEADAKTAHDARALAEQRARDLEAKANPPKEELAEEPRPEQFNNPTEYAKAYADHVFEKKEREEKTAREQEKRDRVVNEFVIRRKSFAEATPDFESAIATSGSGEVHFAVRQAIIESEFGPQILYHLAQHPEEVKKLRELAEGDRIASAVSRIGRLESQFEKVAKKEDPPVVAQEVSRAPPPINPLKGASSPVESLVDSNGVFHGTHRQWQEARKAGKIK